MKKPIDIDIFMRYNEHTLSLLKTDSVKKIIKYVLEETKQ